LATQSKFDVINYSYSVSTPVDVLTLIYRTRSSW